MSVTPFLMFEGRAQEAIDLYSAVLPNVTVETLQPMPPGGRRADAIRPPVAKRWAGAVRWS